KETERQILFSRKLIAAQEGERKRLAAELHDGVGQNLLIVSNLTQMGLKKPDDAQKHLNNISETIKESIKDIRQISRDLHPYQIEELGVTIAIQSLVSRIKESGEIIFHDFIENIDRYLNLDESINLFRIVQEAITNTIKHSQAKNVVISLSYVGNKIQLVVSDDGIGISGHVKSSEHLGLGLRTMQERSIALNGNFEIESNNKTGTTIKVLILK
ncbi:MAG: sensor histidine kinase, partial [Ignavibacteria bacterium]|nr:sensor histidine kinase [Ignavibacteria bacterium]